jgi:hypothetical protein
VPKKFTGVRLPEDLIARIDAYAKHRNDAEPGLNMNRTQAFQVLLEAGLLAAPGLKREREKAEDKPKPQRARRPKA